jgi:1-acyl-sn-glycerol-3-phosphate acyltransferase
MLDVAITANKDNPEVYKAMVELKQKFLTALSSKQDATTKLLVAQLKHDDDQ